MKIYSLELLLLLYVVTKYLFDIVAIAHLFLSSILTLYIEIICILFMSLLCDDLFYIPIIKKLIFNFDIFNFDIFNFDIFNFDIFNFDIFPFRVNYGTGIHRFQCQHFPYKQQPEKVYLLAMKRYPLVV